MVITILEAQVSPNRVEDIEREYREGMSEVPPEIRETFLVRDTRDSTQYRIITVWESMAALQAMRASAVTPRGVQIFNAAGAEPDLSIVEVVVHRGKNRPDGEPVAASS